jgi:hypothetical protein
VATRTRALGRNEALFREINDYIAELCRSLPAEDQFEVLCECEQLGCVQTIAVSKPEYEAARASDITFIVIPGHEAAEGERVVLEGTRYLLVEKTSA